MITRRNKLSSWHPGTRRFRTRVLRYLQARCDALDNIGSPSDATQVRLQTTRDILSKIDRMR